MKTMKYTVKNIFGFDNIMHSLIPFNCNDLKECWGARIDNFIFVKENGIELIKFNFSLNGDLYGIILKPQNDKGDYKGKIICSGEDVGSCFYAIYKNPTRTLLWGDWTQNDFTWPSLIELIE